MVSGASFNTGSQKDMGTGNSSQIRILDWEKSYPGTGSRVQGVKKAPDPGSATLAGLYRTSQHSI
jgi:hypothetical protein